MVCVLARTQAGAIPGWEKVRTYARVALPILAGCVPWLMRNLWVYGLLMPEQVTSRRLYPEGIEGLLLYPERMAEFVSNVFAGAFVFMPSPSWILSTRSGAPSVYLIAGITLSPVAVSLIINSYMCLRRVKKAGWTRRDWLWAGIVLSILGAIAMLAYMCVHDWLVYRFCGRYMWETLPALSLLWVTGVWSVHNRRIRSAMLALLLSATLATAVWVQYTVIGFHST